jgi:hypothetical protein
MSGLGRTFKCASVGLAWFASLGFGAQAFAQTTSPSSESPDAPPVTFSISAAASYIGSSGANGAALSPGIRWGIGRHLAVSLDLGYGSMGTSGGFQDRWWIIPAAALVIPTERLRFDLGFGAGVGTASGFASLHNYSQDKTIWAVQLIPTLRLHGLVSMELTPKLDGFVGLAATLLLLDGNSLGVRTGTPPSMLDTAWLGLWVGVRFRLL